jgi:hypothetical protein
MGAVETTYTFTATDTITSTKMNNIIGQTVMASDSITGTTLEISSGRLKVRAAGITSNELAAASVTSNAIADGAIVDGDINASAAIALSKLATGALPTAITIATANITDANVTTAKIADANITAAKLSGAQTGSAPIFGPRAWANFNAKANSNATGTYSRSGSTTISIAVTGHGLIVGNQVFLDFNGSVTEPFNGIYEVATVTDANNFTVISSATATSSGTLSILKKTVRASGNVACVSAAAPSPVIPPTANDTPADGYYILNFSTALPNANYAISGALNEAGALATTSGNDILGGFGFNEKCAYLTTINGGSVATDCLYNSVVVIG